MFYLGYFELFSFHVVHFTTRIHQSLPAMLLKQIFILQWWQYSDHAINHFILPYFNFKSITSSHLVNTARINFMTFQETLCDTPTTLYFTNNAPVEFTVHTWTYFWLNTSPCLKKLFEKIVTSSVKSILQKNRVTYLSIYGTSFVIMTHQYLIERLNMFYLPELAK